MTDNYIGNELDLFKDATNWKKYFSRKINNFIKGDVLEVGAGLGANTFFLSQNIKNINSITCLEPDKDLCEKIRFNNSQSHFQIKKIINGTIEIIEDYYDTIIYIDVLEHIEDSKKEIELIKKKLKKNGHLIILVPAFNFLFSEFDKNIGHFRRYNKKMLKDDINNQLVTKKLFYLDSMGFIASLINKLILRKNTPSKQNILFWDKILINFSKFFDLLIFFKFGKSLIGIYEKKE